MTSKVLVQKAFRVMPDDHELLVQADLENISPEVISGLGLADHSTPPRPIKLRLPAKLKRLLIDIRIFTGATELDILINATHEYRRRYPIDPDWEEPSSFDNKERETKLIHASYRLYPDEHDLLRNLGRGVDGIPHRTAAFEALVPIIEELRETIPNRKELPRISTRIKVPIKLHQAIQVEVAKNHYYVNVLLKAIKVHNKTIEKTKLGK